MKRAVSLLILPALLLSLCACGPAAPAPSVPSAPSASPVPSVPSVPSEPPVPSVPSVPSASPAPSVPSVPSEPPAPSAAPSGQPAVPGLSTIDPDAFQRTPYTDPGEFDMEPYDTSAILSAWERGDPSGLSDYDRAIYGAAAGVLSAVLTDGMSAYEKELALYRWLTGQVAYDWDHQDPLAGESRDSLTPYGALVERKAICLGFASAFQLLLDMAGVECITVVGAAARSTRDHAWNMVRLDGEWYCADPTWDSNSRGRILNYFNVTSDAMAMSGHQWDYAAVPEATAEDGGRGAS